MGTGAVFPLSQEDTAEFCRRWRIRELAVFGSAARGELRPDSDIDVMVEFEPEAQLGLLQLVRIKHELEDAIGRPVDVIEKGTIRNPYRKASIERDLTIVYAA